MSQAWNLAVRIDDSDFVDTYHHPPRGFGAWAFCAIMPPHDGTNEYLHHVIWARGKFEDAVEEASRIAVEMDINTLYVCA